MNAKELKTKSKAELNELMLTLLEEQFQLRMHKGLSENPKTHLFKEVRRNIARVKTVLRDTK
ncbi:MAG: 50S ribosomal protein L29 [Gammaproteobacteria bacterium CG_4_10_14_0_8_um_filter_38_16]|nr:MAG: 50S ribosomal protein L29 [Gammaproteobacteria bacterium CG_4_10_14_0_8_um_filter_38_16]PJA02956.1 MAG: 50S ribosomal protein L29 [Gammaproteobacteria bacterium CG_4_10_14_0_2_um_filter_38_22]PJB11451.1 MAG: 50S ribosomal protein L29 [Gammaproteobacteria bacterium CG_4_9_14_3_um_filter_38_9]